MEFKDGTRVYTENGREAGSVDRVVVDPKTQEITHIIVRKGLLFTEDKVVPMKLVTSATADRVTLSDDIDDFNTLPQFEETHYLPIDEADWPAYHAGDPQPLYWYPYGPTLNSSGSYLPPLNPVYQITTTENIPEGTVAVEEGARVYSADGKHVGNIKRVYFDPDTDRVTAILIARGLILKEEVMIPAHWITTYDEETITLAVNANLLERQASLTEKVKDMSHR